MITGEYPCCNGPLTLAMPDRTPAALGSKHTKPVEALR